MNDTDTPPQGTAPHDSQADTQDSESSGASEQKRLIGLFSDGKLPTGNNFAELITSMVMQSTFDDHVQTFEKWKTRGDIQIGPPDVGWQLQRLSPSKLVFHPDLKNTVTPDSALIDFFGWTKAYGQIGAVQDTKAFATATPNMAHDTLASVASDGRWKVIMEMPGRVCAFDLVLATAAPAPSQKPGVGDFLSGLFGYIPPENSILRATATATGPNQEPRLSNQSTTRAAAMKRSLKKLLLVLAALILLAVLSADFAGRDGVSGAVDYIKEKIESFLTEDTAAESSAETPSPVITPAADGSTPASDGSTPASDGSTPASDGSTPASDGSTPASDGSTPASDGSTPASDGSTPASDGSTPASDGSTPASDGSTPASDGSTPASDGSTPASDGSTPASDGSKNETMLWYLQVIGGTAGGLALAYLLRRVLQVFSAQRNGLQLRWKKTGGSRRKGNRTWRLEAKGPDLGQDAKLYYYITALWG